MTLFMGMRKRTAPGDQMLQGYAKPWLGAGEMVIVMWPSDCNKDMWGAPWSANNWDQLVYEASKEHVTMWFRGRCYKRSSVEGAPTGVKAYKYSLTGPEGLVLPWYEKIRQCMYQKRGSKRGLPHPRKVILLQCTNIGLQLIENTWDDESGDMHSAGGPTHIEELSDDEEFRENPAEDRKEVVLRLNAGPQADRDEAGIHAADDNLVDDRVDGFTAMLQKRFRTLWAKALDRLKAE